jgi:hypothetical protein
VGTHGASPGQRDGAATPLLSFNDWMLLTDIAFEVETILREAEALVGGYTR